MENYYIDIIFKILFSIVFGAVLISILAVVTTKHRPTVHSILKWIFVVSGISICLTAILLIWSL